MDFGLSDEHKIFIQEIKEFCIKECSDVDIAQLEESGTHPGDIEQKLVERGWYGLPIPVEYNGSGRKVFDVAILIQELIRGGYPFPGRLMLITLCTLNILHNASEEQKKEILPKVVNGETTLSISVTEPNAGSDIASLRTKAVPKDGGFSITGQKVYSSGAAADNNIIIVGTRTSQSEKKHEGLTCFLVPSRTKGIEFRLLNSMGRRIGGLYEVFFEDVWVPRENVLGKVNEGWNALTIGFNVERAIVSATFLGFAERIFSDIVKIIQQRSCKNRLLCNYGAISQEIAEAAAEIEAARLLTYYAICLIDEGKPAIEEVSQSKVYCSELVKRLGDMALRLAGGRGYMMDTLIQWYFRESRVATTGGGSSQIMRDIAGAVIGLKSS